MFSLCHDKLSIIRLIRIKFRIAFSCHHKMALRWCWHNKYLMLIMTENLFIFEVPMF